MASDRAREVARDPGDEVPRHGGRSGTPQEAQPRRDVAALAEQGGGVGAHPEKGGVPEGDEARTRGQIPALGEQGQQGGHGGQVQQMIRQPEHDRRQPDETETQPAQPAEKRAGPQQPGDG